MSSILERSELNKIFLIYGNLDDMFISPDLQKNNLRPFLNAYLKNLGYRQIVFYSGAKNVGKFVLDDECARLAINSNKGAGDTAGSRLRMPQRPMSPKARPAASEDDAPSPPPAENGSDKLVYKQPKITPAEFLDDAKKIMSDGSVKSAIVFTFFQDFISDNAAPLQPYLELLSHLWDEYSLDANENICIFLAPQMDADALKHILSTMQNGQVLLKRFFNADGTINRRFTIGIGLPSQDELRFMLEYLRIVGEKGKTILYDYAELPHILSSLMYLSREAERDENRAGYLSAIYNNIVWHMEKQADKVVPISNAVVKNIYRRYKGASSSNPMEQLMETRGWESVAKRVSEIVKDYSLKKKEADEKAGPVKQEKKRIYERLESSDNVSDFRYPIPHFILKGNPGVGKTTVARLIGQIFYEAGILKKGNTIEAKRDDLVGQYVGQTAIKTTACVASAEDGVLFIDDAYSLLDKGDGPNYPKEAIDTLIPIMTNPDKYHFCMIMAGYPEPMDELLTMNAGLRSRFSEANILTIEDYPPDLLQEIFVENCRKAGYRIWGEGEGEEKPLDMQLFFKNMYAQRNRADFGNARDVLALANEVKMQASLRDNVSPCIVESDFGTSAKYFVQHGVESIDDIYREIDRYVGLDFIKDLFRSIRLEIMDSEDCKRRGIKPEITPDHFIFSGNPGTGKTTVGKMIGKFYHLMEVLGGAETLFVDASNLTGSHYGDSKNKVTEVIQKAIDHNQVLYIDEAYQIIDTAYSGEIVGAMMTKMTENAADFKMIFGMYSNRVEEFLKLNAGLSRRLRIVQFPDYNPEQLVRIFDRTLEDQGRTITDEAHNLIRILMEYKYNTRTESFGNAGEVKKLVVDMKRNLLERVERNGIEGEERYVYTVEDIPKDQVEKIKDQINPRSLDDIMREINEQIGMSNIKEIIVRKQEEMAYAKKSHTSIYGINPGYYFFVGNPGTGKSTSAKLFGECLHELGIVKTANFYACTAKDLIGTYMGETDKKTYALLKKSVNGVLFIDEAYSLSYADSLNTDSSYKKEALEQIIAFLDEPEHRNTCCIIFAGYQKDMQGLYQSNSGMRSRIEEVYFQDYSPNELYEIFALFCRKNGFEIQDGVKEAYLPIFRKLVDQKYYANGRTARTVYEKTAANLKRRVVRDETLSEEEGKLISISDLLSEEECLKIVSAQ